MTTTYYESAGTGQTAELLNMTQDAATSTFVMSVARGTPQVATFKAPANNPGAGVSNTGTYTVNIELTTASDVTGNCSLAVQIIRYNSAGTAQATVSLGASQTITSTGTKTFTGTNLALGTWAAGDVVGMKATITNNNTSGTAKTFTVRIGGATNTFVAPWTYTTPVALTVANAAEAQTAGAVTITTTVTTKENLFTTQAPATPTNTEAVYTLGTVFKPAVNGKIIGVRVWCSTAQTGTIGGLYSWTSDTAGTLLASKTFGTLTANGWTNVFFDTPVAVTAGTKYVTAWGNTANYGVTSGFFTSTDLVNGNLTAPKVVAGTNNGKFIATGPAIAYPDGNFGDSCYFVDTIFVADTLPGTTLVVANAAHAQSAESPTLVRNISLTVANATQAETAGSPTIVRNISLTVQNASQTQTAGSVLMVLTTGLVVQGATQAEIAATPALTQVHVLTVQNASQAEAANSPSLTQIHQLSVQNVDQAETVGSPALVQVYTLDPQDADQDQTAGSPVLTQVHNLAVQGANQGQTAGSPVLARIHNLVPQNANQAQSTGSPALTQLHVLAVQNAQQSQVVGNAVLIVGGTTLTIANARQSQSAGSVALTQVHILAVQNANQLQSTDSYGLTQVHVLSVEDVDQAHSVETPALVQVHFLDVQDAMQAQAADNVVLSDDVRLLVDDSFQDLRVESVTINLIVAPTAKERRLKIQDLLEELLGSPHVYFQPPPNVTMQYPCIVYTRSYERSQFAANVPYIVTKRYTVTVIDRDPDSSIPNKVAALPMCSYERFFTADNLNHDVFNLYFN